VRIGVERRADEWEVTSDADLTGATGTLVLLADPFTFPTAAFLDDLAIRSPGLTIVGGMASAAAGPGGNRLVADDVVVDAGGVGLLLPETVAVTALVSQGGEPVGAPLVVTRASGRMIEEIAGRPALDRVLGLADDATAEVRSRLARGLALGIVVDERKLELDRADVLLRPVLGADKERRAVAVGAEVPVGTTVQFLVRDADAADADLREILADAPGRAALAFVGTARGTQLFDAPHHDAALVHEHVEGGAVAGMFSSGEVGPVGGRAHLHAGSVALLLFDDA
jgi:small ligand-binding sensory domain FIST